MIENRPLENKDRALYSPEGFNKRLDSKIGELRMMYALSQKDKEMAIEALRKTGKEFFEEHESYDDEEIARKKKMVKNLIDTIKEKFLISEADLSMVSPNKESRALPVSFVDTPVLNKKEEVPIREIGRPTSEQIEAQAAGIFKLANDCRNYYLNTLELQHNKYVESEDDRMKELLLDDLIKNINFLKIKEDVLPLLNKQIAELQADYDKGDIDLRIAEAIGDLIGVRDAMDEIVEDVEVLDLKEEAA